MDMALVIVSASVTSFILILLLLGPLGKNADLKARRISDAVRKVKVEKYEELATPSDAFRRLAESDC